MALRSGLFGDQRGAHLVEYIVLVGLISLATLAGYRVFGARVAEKADAHAACIERLACAEKAAPGGAVAAVPGSAQPATKAPATASPAATPPQKKKGGGGGLLSGVSGHVVGIGGGFLRGAASLVTGTWDAVTHPKETAIALGSFGLLVARLQTGDPSAYVELGQMTRASARQVHAAWKKDPDDVIGRALFEIVTVLAPTKAAKVVHVARTSRAAGGAELAVAGKPLRAVAAADDVASGASAIARQTQRTAGAYADPKLWRELDAALYRGDQVDLPFYFRGDGRPPSTVFQDGFQAGHFEHYDFPVTYASRNPAHAARYGVRKAESDGYYVYVVRKTDDALDVAREFPGNDEWAIAYPGGLPGKDVVGVIRVETPWIKHNNHAIAPRDFIPNPRFE